MRPSGDMAIDSTALFESVEKYFVGELVVPSDQAQLVSIAVKAESRMTICQIMVVIHIPHAHRLVVRAGDDEPAVGRERE
jgi:hypothetical protein